MTLGLSLSDFRVQGKGLISTILDMKRPPTGRLGLENIYVMLSRISSWDGLAILRPFEDSVLQGVPDERLDAYDEFLEQMHIDTRSRVDLWLKDKDTIEPTRGISGITHKVEQNKCKEVYLPQLLKHWATNSKSIVYFLIFFYSDCGQGNSK